MEKDWRDKIRKAKNDTLHLASGRDYSVREAIDKFDEQLHRMFKEEKDSEKEESSVNGKDQAYKERNILVKNLFRRLANAGVEVGYKESSEYGEGWKVWTVTHQMHPKFGVIEQMGWHTKEEDMNPESYEFMQYLEDSKVDGSKYDGHSTVEKYDRLNSLESKLVKAVDENDFNEANTSRMDIEPSQYRVVDAMKIEDTDDLMKAFKKD